MKEKKSQTFIVKSLTLHLGWILLLSGCSSLTHREGGFFKNSTLSNLNPAPHSLSPTVAPSGQEIVDPLFMRSQADYHFTVAEALSLEGEKAKAIEEFKLTLVYDPKSVEVRLRLAKEYVRIGLLSEAIEQAEAAIHLDPGQLEGHMLLGSLYSSLKMYDQALVQYKIVIEIDNTHDQAAVLIGAVLAEQKKFDEAEKYFDKVAQNPKNKTPYLAHYYKAKIREERGPEYFKKAIESYSRSISLSPRSEKPVIGLAQLYIRMDQEKRAERLVNSFEQKFGPTQQGAQFLSKIYLEQEEYDKAYKQLEILEGFEEENLNLKVKMALILIEKKKYTQAVTKLEQILSVAPESDKIRFYLGAVYEEIKNAKLAIENFEMIPSFSSYYGEAVIHTAHLYKGMKNMKKARETIENAIEQKDGMPEFYAFYASILDEMRDYKVAIAMLTKAVEKFPTHTQLRFYLGSMHDRVGDKKKTVDEMKRVVAIDDEHVQALNFLAYTYAELGENLEEAKSLAEKALSLSPNDGYILDTMGWVLFKNGENTEAIRYLEAAFRHKQDESVVAEHLGDAYYRSELAEKAKVMYQKAAALETDLGKKARIREKIFAITNQIKWTQFTAKKPLRQPASITPETEPVQNP
ncbi:MAG: tetratricopeptide repeat protein [Bdellovibrionales bacterium]|nr:tetratricopeptide repeat protein [Bdellovibrionales bacterium]